MINAEARFNNSLRPRKPEGSLGRTAQDVHLDSHTAPELLGGGGGGERLYTWRYTVTQGGGGGEKREIMYLSLHCHHQNDSCIKMGSDESHFNVSEGSDGQSHKTVSTNHNPFLKRKESRSGIEPRSFRFNALPSGQTDAMSY